MKKILIVLVILAAAALGWYLYKHHASAPADEAAAAPAAKVETSVLKEEAIAETIEVFGVVAASPSGEHVISAPYDTTVQKVHVSVGTTVAAGDALMEIVPSADAKLGLDSARSALALATKNRQTTQERFDLKLATIPELEAAQQAEEDAKLKVASFEARGLGGDGKIVAAVAGVVSKLDVTAGTLAAQGTPLVTVSTGGQMEARLGVEATDVNSVKPDQPVTLQSSNRPETAQKFSGVVRSVGGSLDATTGAAEVRVPLAIGTALFLGEHVRAAIQIKQKDKALVAPRSAVLPEDDKHVLFTVKDGKAVKHEVQTGLITDETIEVISDDLHAGDIVVTLGNYELEDGMAVQAAEKEAAKADEKSDAKVEAKPDAKAAAKPETKPAPEEKP
ncbi:MAG: family efflux transporter, subunit [Verrucomicrobia bacterium]|nr:family efflux transporter, subunit [Verrucomicrobiota bacterium]